MIKLKNILNEHYWNERKFGEPLPKLQINEGVFQNQDADKYLTELTELLGEPTYQSDKEHGWYDVTLPETYGKYKMLTTKVDKVYIVDESVKHSFPADHRDYVYTTYLFFY